MGRIILCQPRQAVIPYRFTNTKVEVYSYEELCFYIYNNVALLNPEQFQGKLVQWTKTELEKLAAEASLTELLVTILSAGSYYETAEIQQFRDKQELVALLPEEEKLKLKADSFLMYKRLLKAISLYNTILRREDQIEDRRFLGDVYHNKGVALAKNMEVTNQKPASLEAYIVLRLQEAEEAVVEKEARAFGMDEADFQRLMGLLEDATEDAESTSVYTRYQKALYNKERGDYEAFNQRIDMMLNQWKEDFREQIV